eukprot:2505747-Prymnesium_polylepis.1
MTHVQRLDAESSPSAHFVALSGSWTFAGSFTTRRDSASDSVWPSMAARRSYSPGVLVQAAPRLATTVAYGNVRA